MPGRPRRDPGLDPLGWMFTFSDVVTLIFTFFVMMLAVRQPDLAKFQVAFGEQAAKQAQATASGQGGPGQSAGRDGQGQAGPVRASEPVLATGNGPTVPVEELAEGPPGLAQELDLPVGRGGFPAGALQPGASLREDPRGTAITLANDLLFAPGSATLSAQAGEGIAKVAGLLRHGRQPICVEGHTDDLPVPAGKPFKDNWELSLVRAVAVAQRLAAAGLDPARLRVSALGGSRPLALNDSAQNRAKNRRTEIIVLTEGG